MKSTALLLIALVFPILFVIMGALLLFAPPRYHRMPFLGGWRTSGDHAVERGPLDKWGARIVGFGFMVAGIGFLALLTYQPQHIADSGAGELHRASEGAWHLLAIGIVAMLTGLVLIFRTEFAARLITTRIYRRSYDESTAAKLRIRYRLYGAVWLTADAIAIRGWILRAM